MRTDAPPAVRPLGGRLDGARVVSAGNDHIHTRQLLGRRRLPSRVVPPALDCTGDEHRAAVGLADGDT